MFFWNTRKVFVFGVARVGICKVFDKPFVLILLIVMLSNCWVKIDWRTICPCFTQARYKACVNISGNGFPNGVKTVFYASIFCGLII